MNCGSRAECIQKLLGINMAIVSPVVFGLGVADLALTTNWFCYNLERCNDYNTGLTLTWIATAVWASIPLFLNGISAFWHANKPPGYPRGWLCLLSFVNTFVFGPALIIIPAFEVVKKFPDMHVEKSWKDGSDSTGRAILNIILTTFILGAVLFLHALALFFLNCCCGGCENDPCCNPGGAPEQCGPHQHNHHFGNKDLDHMNMWSAYRWGNKNGAAQQQLAFKSQVYSVGAQPGNAGYSPSCSQGASCQHQRRW